jgi:FKBP-type peptidyl-prolyl cis-trans isomerase FklB
MLMSHPSRVSPWRIVAGVAATAAWLLACTAHTATAESTQSAATAAGPAGGHDAAYAGGYRLGVTLAENREQDGRVDLEAVLKGLLDALADARTGDGPAAAGGAAPAARAGAYVDDYAALNAQRPGVVVLPSGLQYEVLASGDGERPGPRDVVTVDYRGYLPTGVTFDSTDAESGPARLQVDQIVIRGLKEALLLMRVGDRWRVTIPASLGFTRKGMLRKRDLIYEIELLAVEAAPHGAP